MTQVRDVLGRARPLAVAVLFTAAAIIPALSIHLASADPLTNRSLMVTSTAPSDVTPMDTTPGAADNGQETGHTYTFTVSQDGTIQGFRFLVCDNAFGYITTCATPAGFVAATTMVIGDVEVEMLSGSAAGVKTYSTLTRSAANEWSITDATGTAFETGDVVEIKFTATAATYFQNPTTAYISAVDGNSSATQGTYFVHISTHSDDGTLDGTTMIDEGTVTNNVATAIDINTRVQETLKFSVEGDMRDGTDNITGDPTAGTAAFNEATSAGAGCTPLTGKGTILMGDVANQALAASDTYDAMSYFRLATNSAHGVSVYYAGQTLASGGEVITPIGAVAAAATTQTEQFGLTIDQASASNTVDTDGNFLDAVAPYTSSTAFAFVATPANTTPQPIASSDGIVECDTAAVKYIANIAEETAAGLYSTRIIYIASPSY